MSSTVEATVTINQRNGLEDEPIKKRHKRSPEGSNQVNDSVKQYGTVQRDTARVQNKNTAQLTRLQSWRHGSAPAALPGSLGLIPGSLVAAHNHL